MSDDILKLRDQLSHELAAVVAQAVIGWITMRKLDLSDACPNFSSWLNLYADSVEISSAAIVKASNDARHLFNDPT